MFGGLRSSKGRPIGVDLAVHSVKNEIHDVRTKLEDHFQGANCTILPVEIWIHGQFNDAYRRLEEVDSMDRRKRIDSIYLTNVTSQVPNNRDAEVKLNAFYTLLEGHAK